MAHSMRRLLFDLDGVLANYEGRYKELGGDPSEKGKDKANRFRQPRFQDFYLHLDMMPEADRLWAYGKEVCAQGKAEGPWIMSAASNFQKSSKPDKHTWVQRHLRTSGPHVVIVDYPKDKQKHCRPGDILVDDNAKNCEEWEAKGGIAIRHVSVSKTIASLKALFAHESYSAHHVNEAFESLKTANVQEAFAEIEAK